MKNIDVDLESLKKGLYCQKEVSGCFCAVGWLRERQCLYCKEENDNRDSYCICPPKEIRIEIPVWKIVPPKWYFIFLPWKWKHLLLYKKRKLKPIYTKEM